MAKTHKDSTKAYTHLTNAVTQLEKIARHAAIARTEIKQYNSETNGMCEYELRMLNDFTDDLESLIRELCSHVIGVNNE